jgi:hypothetical protein
MSANETVEDVAERIANAICRDVQADDMPHVWTGLDAQDVDQIPEGMDVEKVEALVRERCLAAWNPATKQPATVFRSINLTAEEMALLDDGRKWWDSDSDCWLGGHISSDWQSSPEPCNLDLAVDGETHDNWTAVHLLPESIRQRLINA